MVYIWLGYGLCVELWVRVKVGTKIRIRDNRRYCGCRDAELSRVVSL